MGFHIRIHPKCPWQKCKGSEQILAYYLKYITEKKGREGREGGRDNQKNLSLRSSFLFYKDLTMPVISLNIQGRNSERMKQ